MSFDPPADIQALLDAYIAVTGLAVKLSYQRQSALTDLIDRGITAEDVTAVMQKLKRLVARGEKGFSESSLDFRNALGNVDTFEERALKLRQEAFRRQASKPKAQVAVVRGDVTVLDDAPAAEVPASRSLVQETLRAIANGL